MSISNQPIKLRFLTPYSDVTSEESLVSFNVYDRVAEHLFLGTVQIKPVLIHDHTVDQWYKYVLLSYYFPPCPSNCNPDIPLLMPSAYTDSGRSKTK